MNDPIRPLGFPFTKNGFTHELLGREGLVCIVRRSKHGSQMHFEVVRLRERKESTFERGGKVLTVPSVETYPRSEDWGTYGFTYRSLDQAKAKFQSMLSS